MRLSITLALAALPSLAACGRTDAPDAPANASPTTAAPDAAPVAPPAPTPAEPPLDELAGIKVGDTLAALKDRGIDARQGEVIDPDNRCSYASLPSRKNVSLMLDEERVVRIDVGSSAYPILGGVTVGMDEAEAVRRLGKRVQVQPHPYTGPDGHYLIVHQADEPLGLILETDGKTVLSYRIGLWEQVQWIEGCL